TTHTTMSSTVFYTFVGTVLQYAPNPKNTTMPLHSEHDAAAHAEYKEKVAKNKRIDSAFSRACQQWLAQPFYDDRGKEDIITAYTAYAKDLLYWPQTHRIILGRLSSLYLA